MSDTLPPGFTLDQPASAHLPPGFAVDPPPHGPSSPLPQMDDYGRPVPEISLSPEGAAVPAPIARIGAAAADAWRNTPEVFTPQMQAVMDQGPLGRHLWNPAAKVAGDVLGGVNALGAGLAATVGETATAAGAPGLGRDLNIMGQVAPIVMGGAPSMPLTRAGLVSREASVPNALNPRFTAERTAPPATPDMSPLDRMTQLIRHDSTEADIANGRAPVPADMPTPNAVQTMTVRPGAVGADITTAPIPPKTPAERITDLEKSVQQTAEERAGPQLHDTTPYVPGIPPRLLASSDFKPVNSLDEKVAIASDPAFRAEVEANARDRNTGMVDLLRGDAQDGNALDHAHDARSEVTPGPLGVFVDEKPVDASGIVDSISRYLHGAEGKQGAVRNTLKSVLDSLHDADGNLETLPSILYGARKNLTDLLKKGVKGTSDMADDVRASKPILMSLLPKFDETISTGAPKFSEVYLPKFHEMSQPINQMEFLQKYQTGSMKITDGDGYLIPSKVQKMLDDILQGVKAPGVHPAKALTEAQIQNVINVRNELAAGKLRDRMAAVKGADTFQQINRAITPTDTPGRAAVRGGAVWGAHGAMMMTPAAGWGNALLGGYQAIVKPAVKAANERKAAAAISARKNQLLTPPNALGPED